MTVQKRKEIFARKGIKQISLCTSAEGGLLVTAVSGAPTGTLGLVSDSGQLTRELFLNAVHQFLNTPQAHQIKLLICDYYECYLSIEGLNLVKDNGVINLILHPHNSNKLHPVFSSFNDITTLRYILDRKILLDIKYSFVGLFYLKMRITNMVFNPKLIINHHKLAEFLTHTIRQHFPYNNIHSMNICVRISSCHIT